MALDEAITFAAIAGLVLILGGVGIAARPRRRASAELPDAAAAEPVSP